ncbi:MAG TPA: hybrid sensor histidine kinase/response regulator [Candidatus Riflebacteria bacterium]|jgi:PAS domain S-box-containing protein|nr:hybrid sensor histidine kinase/response regulator [Candidatus Riflebacteria bacterium]
MTQIFSNASTESGQAYANLLANLPGMVYRCQNQQGFPMEFVSEGCFELTGYTSKELTGNNRIAYGDLIYPEDQRMVWDSIQKAVQQHQPFVLEYRIFKKNGQLRWVWEKGRAAFTDSHKGVLDGIIIDITSRKEAEEANRQAHEELLESNARFRMLTELAPVGIIISDAQQRILHLNQRFTDLFGYTVADMPSAEEWWPLAYPDPVMRQKVREDWTALIEAARLNHGEIFSYEAQVSCKNGSIRQIDFRATSNGELIFVISTDITERCRLENQLRMAHKMESVGRLAGGIAHDFNNMLGVIIGYSEMAIDRVKEDTELLEDLNEILAAGKRSREITRQLLAFARKQSIKPVAVDLNELVDSMLNMLRRLLGENINLTWLPQNGLWPVKLDPAQLDQILANICINSRDAISGSGSIIIETSNAIFDSEYCFAHQGFVPGEFAMIAISDNGCGMSKEALKHIYEPFFTTKGMAAGTGMGLPTVYGIVKQNNGFINIYSELNRGTSVKIYLPRLVNETTPQPKPQKAAVKGNNELLLLVEDEPTLMKMTKMLLERLGYQVMAAGTPGKALEIARSEKGSIQLLITDIVMPEMDGVALSEQIKKIHPEIRTLFMSGYTSGMVTSNDIVKTGCHFIQKPFSIEEMAKLVDKILNKPADQTD